MKGRIRPYASFGPARQSGAVLLFCLVFLTILTLMAASSMDSAIFEERMAGNMQDFNQAFQAAEVAMESAEAWLAAQTNLPATSGDGSTVVWSTDGPDPDADANAWWWERDTAWWTDNAQDAAGLETVTTQPQYVIEEYFTSTEGQSLGIGTGELVNTRVIHRITARGTGGSDNARVLLQSTYVRPYD